MTWLQFSSSLISTVQFTVPCSHIRLKTGEGGKGHNLRNWFHYKFMVSNLVWVLAILFLITNQTPNLCHSLQICYSTPQATLNKEQTKAASWWSPTPPPFAPVLTFFSAGPKQVAPLANPPPPAVLWASSSQICSWTLLHQLATW